MKPSAKSGQFFIFNIIILFLLFNLCLDNITAQSCLPNDITLSNQTQVDTFLLAYPGCKQIRGSIYISSLPDSFSITNLNSIKGIESIDGAIKIKHCPGLINITGLDSLISIGIDTAPNGLIFGLYLFNTGITSLDGLNKLTYIKGDVDFQLNKSLKSINGFKTLNKVDGRFSIGSNNSMTEVNGFNELESIGTDFKTCYFQFFSNKNLLNINGFNKLSSIQGGITMIDNSNLLNLNALISIKSLQYNYISITSNPKLKSLSGLDNIDYKTISYIKIEGSENLKFCSVPSICNFLNNTNNIYLLGSNATGCNSKDEILAACCTMELSILETNSSLIANVKGGYPPFKYLWSTGETTDTIIKNSGNYCVTVIDINGCTNILCQTVNTDNVNIQDGIITYPNPTSSLLTIQLNNNLSHEKTFKLIVYQVSGKEIYKDVIPAFAYIHNLDVSTLPAGMYYFSVTDDQYRIYNGKFIVVR